MKVKYLDECPIRYKSRQTLQPYFEEFVKSGKLAAEIDWSKDYKNVKSAYKSFNIAISRSQYAHSVKVFTREGKLYLLNLIMKD